MDTKDPNSQNSISKTSAAQSAPVAPVPPTVTQAGGGKGKEMEPVTAKSGGEAKPTEHVEIIPNHVELEKKPELAGYVEKVEKDAELKTPVMDDYAQQVLLKSANPQTSTITLPLTEEQITLGLHRQVWESIRWLSEWCVRQIKLLHGRVKYK